MRSRTAIYAVLVYHGVGDRVELLARLDAVEAGARLLGVVAGDLARLLDRAGRGDARAALRRAGRRPARARTTSSSRAASRSGSVGIPSRRSVPAIFPVSTVWPAQSRQSSVIWNAMPSARPNAPSSARPAAEQAGGLEELRGLERAALEVLLDGRVGAAPLAALERLARGRARVRSRRGCRPRGVAGRGELGERAREEVVARRPARPRARRPTRPTLGRAAAPRRRSGRRGRGSPCGRARPRRPPQAADRASGRRRQEDEQRPQPLAARGERLGSDLGDEPRLGRRRRRRAAPRARSR